MTNELSLWCAQFILFRKGMRGQSQRILCSEVLSEESFSVFKTFHKTRTNSRPEQIFHLCISFISLGLVLISRTHLEEHLFWKSFSEF